MKTLRFLLISALCLGAVSCGSSTRTVSGNEDPSRDSGLITNRNDVFYANMAEYLTGKVAGVEVSPSGQVIIRGTGTVNGVSDPLFIVDGSYCDDWNSLNPQDIHSVQVLKNPSDTALYGLRGANGVIVITTKAAEKQKAADREARRAAREEEKARKAAERNAKKR